VNGQSLLAVRDGLGEAVQLPVDNTDGVEGPTLTLTVADLSTNNQSLLRAIAGLLEAAQPTVDLTEVGQHPCFSLWIVCFPGSSQAAR